MVAEPIQHPAGSLLDHSQTPGYLDSLKHRMVYSTYSSTSFDNILTVYFPCWPQFNFSSIPSSGLHVGSFFSCHGEVPDSEKIEPFDIPIFLPHELLHSIVHAGPEQVPPAVWLGVNGTQKGNCLVLHGGQSQFPVQTLVIHVYKICNKKKVQTPNPQGLA